jgi:hypothetical protein
MANNTHAQPIYLEGSLRWSYNLRRGFYKKGLDKKWHPVENEPRASSCLPCIVTFLPFRIVGNSLRGDRWRKKMA